MYGPYTIFDEVERFVKDRILDELPGQHLHAYNRNVEPHCWWSTEIREEIIKPRWDNHAQHRTRSNRWRAGTKRNKPKHNWTLKQRGKK